MALPIRATIDDIEQTCAYLATKPTGATLADIRGVLGGTRADSRRMSALESWGLIEAQEEGKYKVTEDGRLCAKDEFSRAVALGKVVRRTPAYLAVVERAAHRREDALSTTDVASHWHDHFKGEVGESDESIKLQAVCFFQVAQGAGLGSLVVGRRGAPTRFSFSAQALPTFVGKTPPTASGTRASDGGQEEGEDEPTPATTTTPPEQPPSTSPPAQSLETKGRGIFIAHGKNKKPLEQLKKILDQFKIPYKVAIDEPNLGRPITGKIRDIMESCNCAILLFTADEEFNDKNGDTIWRPSENVVYELGASGYLYDNRIVIMKEEGVTFPSNFRDLGYISFAKDQIEAKAMDVLKELIGFGMVKVST